VALGYKRSSRVGDMIIKEISEMILRGDIKDPRIANLVLTGIKVTNDLGFARIYFTSLKSDYDKEVILSGLRSATSFIKWELSKRFRIKRIPEIRFEFDETLEEGYRVDDLLRKAKGE